MLSKIQADNVFHIVFIDNLITLLREYKMLRQVEFLELSPIILHNIQPQVGNKLSIPEEFFTNLQQKYNSQQLLAITSACESDYGVKLIQGPPGTGKTHTVIGLISAFLQCRNEGKKPRVLVCAPSNAAVDEVFSRAHEVGFFDEDGNKRSDVKMLRIGDWSKDNTDLRSRKQKLRELPKFLRQYTLMNQVQEYKDHKDLQYSTQNLYQLRKELIKTDEQIKMCLKYNKISKIKSLQLQFNILQQKIAQSKQEKYQRQNSSRNIQQKIINDSDVVFSTLSYAGSTDLKLARPSFEFVVIDEACQGVELSELIPLTFGARLLVMIGDHRQLPPTTFSKLAQGVGYDRSLFERLLECGVEVIMLSTQYRMDPSIRIFPSQTFYNNFLTDAPKINLRPRPRWIPNLPVAFFDLFRSQEDRKQGEFSIYNLEESRFICDLYDNFHRHHTTKLNIGVITPYKEQVFLIRNKLEAEFGLEYKLDIEVNTIDGFQGREKDVIILSCVRNGPSIGFMSDERRMNVAITRGKFAVWIVGHAETLRRNPFWKNYIAYADKSGCLFRCSRFADVSNCF